MSKAAASMFVFASMCQPQESDPVDLEPLEDVLAEPDSEAFWAERCTNDPGDLRVEFVRTFDVEPDELFPYLTHPDKISWLGPFHLTQEGDVEGEPYGAGSIRVVGADGAPIVEEEVTDYHFGEELTYRVNKSSSYEDHCGIMRTFAVDGATVLQWNLRFNAKSGNVPSVLRSYTEDYLGGRLDILENRVED